MPLCRSYISFVAGLAQQNIALFSAASAAGIGVWNAILVGLGYLLSANWQIVMVYYNKYKVFMLLGAVLAVAAYILLKRYLDRREEQALARARQAEEGKRE